MSAYKMVFQKEIHGMADSISSISAAFQAKYKYKIAGQRDSVLSALGPLLQEDFQLNILKSQRRRSLNATTTLDNSTLPDNQKNKQKAESIIETVGSPTRTLRKLARDPDLDNPKGLAAAANSILRELRDATDQYAEARATLTDADYSADDQKFFNDVETQLRALKSIVSRQKTYLRQDGVIFSVDINNALKSIKSIEETISSFSPPAVDGATADAGTTETVDVTV